VPRMPLDERSRSRRSWVSRAQSRGSLKTKMAEMRRWEVGGRGESGLYMGLGRGCAWGV